ncbi:hypothetical protein GE061_009232 [Apolygus lucorum]|uniref:Uncharacterized protein n=1 Tax=Apolygus lucorum TaxID=248454 RepID=A0A6A4K6D5_APOLU|nr:hypothetical protein GE061_009232 [Apolygus lucorum]
MMAQVCDWQVQQESISERAQYILKTGLWSDCKFVVGADEPKREFKAHKLILSMASPVFEKMFQDCYKETKQDVTIVDIQPEAFGAMLNYVYGDQINLQSFDQACELCYVANKYMMPNLLKNCTAYIWQDVNVSNACRGYEFAKLFDQHNLMVKCKKIICQKTSEVISQSSFVEVQISTLKMILAEERLGIRSEMELFEAVEKWAQAEFERLGIAGPEFSDKQKPIYEDLVSKICFLSMQPKEFAEGPALSPLLTKDQSFAILMNITSRNCDCPLPKGFTAWVRKTDHEDTSRNISLKLSLENITPTHNFSPTESTTLFCCNKDIDILGVMVMCQLPYLNSPTLSTNMALYNHMQKYKENLEIFIEDQSTNKIEESSFKLIVEYRSMIDVYFPFPIKMLHGRTYKLGMIMNQPGLYMAGTLNSCDLIHKTVKFTFMKSSEPMFIHGIIFAN